jgi:hypothetical protein
MISASGCHSRWAIAASASSSAAAQAASNRRNTAPGWMPIAFVRNGFPEFVALAGELLQPALEQTRVVRAGALVASDFAELAVRIAASTYCIPSEGFDRIRQAIAAVINARTSIDKEEMWPDG